MILDLVGFISTHFQPKPNHDDPFQIHFSKIPNPNFPKMSTKTLFFDFLVVTLRGVDPSKKMRLVRTIHFHPFSRRELHHASENSLFRRWKLCQKCGFCVRK